MSLHILQHTTSALFKGKEDTVRERYRFIKKHGLDLDMKAIHYDDKNLFEIIMFLPYDFLYKLSVTITQTLTFLIALEINTIYDYYTEDKIQFVVVLFFLVVFVVIINNGIDTFIIGSVL